MDYCGPLLVRVAKYLIAIAVVRIKASRLLFFGRSNFHSSIVSVMCGRVTVARCSRELSGRMVLALFVDIAI